MLPNKLPQNNVFQQHKLLHKYPRLFSFKNSLLTACQKLPSLTTPYDSQRNIGVRKSELHAKGLIIIYINRLIGIWQPNHGKVQGNLWGVILCRNLGWLASIQVYVWEKVVHYLCNANTPKMESKFILNTINPVR